MTQLTRCVFSLLMLALYSADAQNAMQMADHRIIPGFQYEATFSYNILANITDKSIRSIVECTQKCLQSQLCETAIYYAQLQTCILTRERYGLGQLINVGSETASVAILNYRLPAVTFATYNLVNIVLHINQFIYSPNRLFAFGLTNSTLGVYHTDVNGSIGSQFNLQSSTVHTGYYFQAQNDGNLVLYATNGAAIIASHTIIGGSGSPFTYTLLNTGDVIYCDKANNIIWNSVNKTMTP